MRVVLFSVLFLSALLFLALVLYFTLGGGPVEPRLRSNATCKHENLTGICKNKDSCLSNQSAIKLEPCNEGDLSLVCCPLEEMAIPNSLLQTDKNVISNRSKRTLGEKGKERLNATCKHENLTGICKNKDSCLSNLTAIKLEPCNEGDLSLVCCPLEEMAIPNSLLQTDKNVISNLPKRTPGEKAKEMCEIYGKTAYKRSRNPGFMGPQFYEELICEVHERLIKGGEDAKEKEFPHMVEIARFISSGLGGLEGICSGSIVSPEFVLSAAHCVVSKDLYAIFGTIKKLTSGTIQFDEFFQSHITSISDVFIHPHYNTANNNNDIALFKLSIKLNKSERPICLDSGNFIFNNETVIATGFGLNKEQESSDVLQKVELKIVDRGSCATKYKKFQRVLPEYPVCAYAEGKDTCGGDSGGPIQIHHELQCMYTLIGVTSFGINCTRESNLPGVYTKVSPYVGWIEDIVWPA